MKALFTGIGKIILLTFILCIILRLLIEIVVR